MLIVIPCSGRKLVGASVAQRAIRYSADLTPDLAKRLAEARKAIAQEPKLNETALMPAWRRYVGGLYEAASPELQEAIQRGRLPHFLILSGGYGIVRAEEPIGNYNARLVLSRWPRDLLQAVIADYARRKQLHRARLFAGGTTDYARAFRQVPWRDCGVSDAVLYAPRPTKGALVKAPRALGEALGALLTGKTLSNWSSSDGLELRSERGT